MSAAAPVAGLRAALGCIAIVLAIGGPLVAQEPLHTEVGTAERDLFGFCVRIAGDVDKDGTDDIAVGAPGTDGTTADTGAVFVYSGADWRLLHVFRGAVAQGRFGYAVAGAGDANGDGYTDVIVGAPAEPAPGAQHLAGAGCVRVFSGRDGAVLLTVRGSSSGAALGWSVAAVGDVDQDERGDVLIGAPFANVDGALDAGMVLVCSGRNGARLHELLGKSPGERFGWSLASVGDLNGDRAPEILVGVEGHAERRGLTGSARLFSGKTGRLLRNLEAENAESYFGAAVANAGDVDNDGRDDLLVGGWNGEDSDGTRSGTAIVFSGRTGKTLIRVFGNAVHDRFGAAVAGIGDLDGDARPDFAVGAPGDASDRQGYVSAFSSRTGAILFTLVGNTIGDGFGTSIAPGGDRNGDNVPDVLVGAPAMEKRGGLLLFAGVRR